MPFIVLYKKSVIWLSLTEVFTLTTIFTASIFLAEIPSWAFSDIYWRKKKIVIARLLAFSSLIVIAIATIFYMFAFAWLLSWFSFAFGSWTN